MPPAIEEHRTENADVNAEQQNDFCNSRKESNKSFAFSILMNLSTMLRMYTKSFDSMLDRYGAYEIYDFVVQHLTKHPFIAFGMLICVLSFALPFIIFMVFAIATVVMTFTGFVIIEGTLITIASALLFGFLSAVIIFFVCFGFVILAGYFGLVQIYEIIGYPHKRQAIIEYIRGRKTNANHQADSTSSNE